MAAEPKLGDETEKGTEKGAGKGKEGAKEPAAQAEEAKTQPLDPYWLWLQTNNVLKPDDVAVYTKPDGTKIVMCLDGTDKSILNCGLTFSPEVLKKINTTPKKP